jgi:hypothetical protein
MFRWLAAALTVFVDGIDMRAFRSATEIAAEYRFTFVTKSP